MMDPGEIRTEDFRRNEALEQLLDEINRELWVVEKNLLGVGEPDYPLVFIVGPLRSGSTLLLQWLANTGIFAYPTNLLSRFYNAPIVGSKIQLLLTDERYSFRNELCDVKSAIDYSSDNGKTSGALGPNEFWYFWRRFLPFSEIDYLPTSQLADVADSKTLCAELSGIMNVFRKPFALKAMILNYNIDFLDSLFKKAIFIYTKRETAANIESALQARERQLGSIEAWYSFKIPEYYELVKCDPYVQVAGQIHYINRAVEKGLADVADHKKIVLHYETFCENPRVYYNELCDKLEKNGHRAGRDYQLQERFGISRRVVNDEKIHNAIRMFREG